MATPRISFLPGREPSSNFLNRVQDPTDFQGEERIDYWNPEELRASWGIHQRDGIKDHEIDARSSLAATAYAGSVYGAEIDDATGLRIEAKIGRPRVYLTALTPPGFVNLEVRGGSIVNVNGEVIEWDDLELTIPGEAESFGYIDSLGIISVGTSLPPNTEIYTPLFRTTIAGGSIATFDDLRPKSHLAYHPDNYFVLLNTPLVSDDYTANSWERVLVDTTISTFRVNLPASPTNGDRVGILDVIGNMEAQGIIVIPTDSQINNSSANYVINSNFSHTVFVYSSTEDSWYIESSNVTDSQTNPNLFPIQYRVESNDFTLSETDYRTWIDADSLTQTRVVTLPTNLDFGFEAIVQSIGGTTLFVSTGSIETVSLTLEANEAARLIWLDDTDFGGAGVWKALETLTPGTGSSTATVIATTASNLGSGEGVYSSALNEDLRFKSLVAGANIGINSTVDEITISSTAAGGEDYLEVNSTEPLPTATGNNSAQLGTGTNSAANTFQFRSTPVANDNSLLTGFSTPTNYTPTVSTEIDDHLEAIDTALASAGGSSLEVKDEGVSLSTAVDTINFLGLGVTATLPTAGEIAVTITEIEDYVFVNANQSTDVPTSLGLYGVAVGVNTDANGDYSVCIGYSIASSQDHSVAIGNTSTVGFQGVSIGYQNQSANYSVSVGSNALSTGIRSVAIGFNAEATVANAIQLGDGTNSTTDSLQFRSTPVANTTSIQATTQATGVAPTSTPADGTIIIDENGTGTMWVRVAGVWRSTALT